MPLLAIPNISEGRNHRRIADLTSSVARTGARVLDVHEDRAHNRSVITATGTSEELITAMASLAATATYIDLNKHEGVHPRLGGLDVCPFVPVDASMGQAIQAAHDAGVAINEATGSPVYFYGEAARRQEARELPFIRRGGIAELQRKAKQGFEPDIGTTDIDPGRGVVCVGARGPLIAFNVWLKCHIATARWIAGELRSSPTLGGVRALGLPIDSELCQVSMNLTDPDATGAQEAFEATVALATQRGAGVSRTEIVGLVPERYLPPPDATAARLLIKPGRSVEAALRG